MKTYRGVQDTMGAAVMVYPDLSESYGLPWRLDLWNHSPTGLNWGYGGSGPAQLALALLADHLGNDQQAVKLHQRFKWAVVAPMPIDEPWELTSEDLNRALAKLMALAE